jgi:hypothetical protein
MDACPLASKSFELRLLPWGQVDLERVFKFALTRFYKAFVSTKLELKSLDYSIFGISHCVSRFLRDAYWRDLAPGCSLLPGRFIYTTDG